MLSQQSTQAIVEGILALAQRREANTASGTVLGVSTDTFFALKAWAVDAGRELDRWPDLDGDEAGRARARSRMRAAVDHAAGLGITASGPAARSCSDHGDAFGRAAGHSDRRRIRARL